jgi:hypothetical protein
MDKDDITVLLTRRQTLLGGLAAAFGLLYPFQPTTIAQAAAIGSRSPLKPKAKSVILLWMWGGPSHLDTFDPKPAAGTDYCGAFTQPIETNVSGIRINEMLTGLAKQADKYSIIRSMTHDNYAHETAAYMVQTGNKAGDNIVHPGAGAVVSLRKGYAAGYRSLVPPYIVLTEGLGRFSEAGFLGQQAMPFTTGGDPSAARFAVEGIVADGITDQRQRDRRDLLLRMNTMRGVLSDNPSMKELDNCDGQAYNLILGDAGKVFDLSQETDDVRTRYGRNKFGQSCLVARRLVERGVPFITINYGGWDTHKENFQVMKRKLPEFDKGSSTLLQDLSDRGLLDSTIVCCVGEFGRTPKVMYEAPWNGGRGHWGAVFSAWVAGGGFKGGQLVGASDDRGMAVKERPVYPNDLIRAVYELLGIDADSPLPHPQGLIVPAAPAVWTPGTGGRLAEIL